MVAARKVEQRAKCTPEEYLAWEANQETRHEYVDGKIIAMAGESPEHNEIAGNTYIQFKVAFRGRPCKVYMEGVRVRVSPTRYRYPDVVAVCGEIDFADTNPKTLLNPMAIVEVLSTTTERQDYSTKFAQYTRLATITDYLIVAQHQMLVIHHRRQSGGSWETRLHTQPDEEIRIEALEVSLSLAAIYEGIIFPPSEEEGDAEPTI
jgi:Uma2 family endonuclease